MRNAKFLKKRTGGFYRVMALLLCVATILPILHTAGLTAKAESDPDYKSYIGAEAEVIGTTVNLWNGKSDEATSIYYGVSVGNGYLPRYVKITDYKHVSSGDNVGDWFCIEASEGYTWPDLQKDYHWIKVSDLKILQMEGETTIRDGSVWQRPPSPCCGTTRSRSPQIPL